MKNTHCCQCGAPRGVAPICRGFRLDDRHAIYHPCPEPKVNHNPAHGVLIEQHPSLIVAAGIWRNGGDCEDVHICTTCLTKAVRHLRDAITEALGEQVQERVPGVEP